MNDRELLELAAKAGGILTESWYDNDDYFNGLLTSWNPLTDDGDALRLAVNLGLYDLGKILVNLERAEPDSDKLDAITATRRAITRAAAEIEKRIEGNNIPNKNTSKRISNEDRRILDGSWGPDYND